MDFFKWLFNQNKRKKSKPQVSEIEQKIIFQTSHHESGHAVMGYFVGWSVKSVTIYYHDNGTVSYGSNKYNFGDDSEHASFFTNEPNPLQAFNSFEPNEKSQVVDFLSKRILAVLGGPVAEHFYMKGKHVPYTDNLNRVDKKILDTSFQFLQIVDPGNHSFNTSFNIVWKLFQENEIFFKTVKKISSELTLKDQLFESEVDEIIDSIGFTIFLANYNNS